jgi:thioredoxin-dependent peroxiredoxin
MTLCIGQNAPDFSLSVNETQFISLADMAGQRLVLYFYPKDDTTGCTKEAIAFSEAKQEFSKRNTVVLGVSKDNLASHARFKEKYNLTIDLLSDPEGQAVMAYDVWAEKSMYGKKYMGIDRSTFLIDEQGILRQIWRNVKVTGHVESVLKAIDAL